MARYRKIDVRIWNDEKFIAMSPLERLAWFALLTHPQMTPMGSGVIGPGVLGDAIGFDGGWVCPVCHRDEGDDPKPLREGSPERLLEGFREGCLVLLDNRLVIIRNFLIYNRPENPNQLVGWIESVEELPRSECWSELRSHLFESMDVPAWLDDGLLKPLSDNDIKGLKDRFWDRVRKVGGKVSGNVSGKVAGRVTDTPPLNQEQEQEGKRNHKGFSYPSPGAESGEHSGAGDRPGEAFAGFAGLPYESLVRILDRTTHELVADHEQFADWLLACAPPGQPTIEPQIAILAQAMAADIEATASGLSPLELFRKRIRDGTKAPREVSNSAWEILAAAERRRAQPPEGATRGTANGQPDQQQPRSSKRRSPGRKPPAEQRRRA